MSILIGIAGFIAVVKIGMRLGKWARKIKDEGVPLSAAEQEDCDDRRQLVG